MNLLKVKKMYPDCCRACLSKGENIEMISLCGFIEGIQISTMLKNLISKKIAIADGTTKLLCKPCSLALTSAYKFKILCEKSNNLLENYVLQNKIETQMLKEPVRNVTSADEKKSISCTEPSFTLRSDKNMTCCKCKESFSSMDELKIHNRVHTEKLFLCSICGKNYQRSMHLLIHMRSHTGDKPYVCEYCKKGFKQSSDLNVHLKIHTGERKKTCGTCKKSFITSSALNKHLRVHTGDRPFECTICNKRFSESYGLVKHTRVHTGEKPYKCPICKKSFTQSTSLKKHEKIHTKLK